MLSKRMKELKDKLWKAVKKETPLSDTETTEAVAAIEAIASDQSEIYTSHILTGKRIKTTVSDAIINGSDMWTMYEPIVFASENSHHKVVKALIDAKADVDSTNSTGVTPIIASATRRDDPEMVKMLLDAKADPNAHGYSMGKALEVAIRYERPNVIAILKEEQERQRAIQAAKESKPKEIDANNTDSSWETPSTTPRPSLNGLTGTQNQAANQANTNSSNKVHLPESRLGM